MNSLRFLPLPALILLTACATTPEQRAAREQARIEAEQNLQVQLAAQCDQETARLMRQQFDTAKIPDSRTTEAQKTFRTRYIEKVSDPLFQACYKLAWQNYISQQQLREARSYYDYYDGWGYPYPFRRPPFWW